MAKKALLFGDLEHYALIMRERNPGACKLLGRNVRGFDPVIWDRCREGIVYHANLAKFSQNPELKRELLNTGSWIMAKASLHDGIWGIGIKADDPRSEKPKQRKGKNRLGKVLMKVREEL